MKKGKSSISKASSYEEIGEFWSTRDLADYWSETEPAEFEVNIQSEITYFAVDTKLSERIRSLAKKRGISADTLLNLWVQEKLRERKTS